MSSDDRDVLTSLPRTRPARRSRRRASAAPRGRTAPAQATAPPAPAASAPPHAPVPPAGWESEPAASDRPLAARLVGGYVRLALLPLRAGRSMARSLRKP